MATQVLVGAPNTIEEDIIKQTMDEELKILEKKSLLTNKDYKLTRSQSKKWISYAVVREFPAGMPWEGAEEKSKSKELIMPGLPMCSMYINPITKG